MTSISFIEKRIVGKQKELDKLMKKLGRIKAAEATGWEKNPYYYDEAELRRTVKDIETAKEALKKYQSDLQTATEKENSRNVAAILEFLEGWKTRCLKFYGDGLKKAFDEKAKLNRIYHTYQTCSYGTPEYKAAYAEYESQVQRLKGMLHGRFETRTSQSITGRTWTERVKVETGELEYIMPYMQSSYEESIERLKKILQDEANRKYDFIIERTNAIVGEITDATALYIGDKGDLNGFIIGTRGKAKVQTIGAGGYNIQVYHFRTLIHAA